MSNAYLLCLQMLEYIRDCTENIAIVYSERVMNDYYLFKLKCINALMHSVVLPVSIVRILGENQMPEF